jgi:hypothetical protein
MGRVRASRADLGIVIPVDQVGRRRHRPVHAGGLAPVVRPGRFVGRDALQRLHRRNNVLLAFVFIGIVNTAMPFVLIPWGERLSTQPGLDLNGTVPLFTIVIATSGATRRSACRASPAWWWASPAWWCWSA